MGRPTRRSRSNKAQQDETMTNTGNKFESLPKQSFDLRYWPSTIAPETPSNSPVRNYLLHEWPPYKTELPSDLRRVQQYFKTDYQSRHPHPKILSVHIGSGETMLSDPIPPTRRLFARFIAEHLSHVHYNFVKWKPGSDSPIDPHPDDDFFREPRRSGVFGTDFPTTDDSLPVPPRRGSPSREEILADYFRGLHREGDVSKASMRDKRQQTKGLKSTDDELNDDGDIEMQGLGNAKKPNIKKQRQKRQLNARLAAQAFEDANKNEPFERKGEQGPKDVDDNSVEGEDKMPTAQDELHMAYSRLLGSMACPRPDDDDDGYAGTGANSLPVRNKFVPEQAMAGTHGLHMYRSAGGTFVPPAMQQHFADQFTSNTPTFGMHHPATGANNLHAGQHPFASQGMGTAGGFTDAIYKPDMGQMHHSTSQHEQDMGGVSLQGYDNFGMPKATFQHEHDTGGVSLNEYDKLDTAE